MEKIFYSFSALSLKGKEISMDLYKNKVVVVVNTASKCGFTPQYAQLEELYKKYKEDGLVILGFPCNQFGQQEQRTQGAQLALVMQQSHLVDNGLDL